MTPESTIDEGEVTRQATAIARRFDELRARIDAAGGDDVAVLAVTKGHPIEVVAAAQRLGLSPLGEDRARELAGKVTALQAAALPAVRWHFIGQLQTNKVRQVADHVAVWQSVDRLRLGREIAKRAPGAVVYTQVNLSDDPNRGGCSFDEVDELVEELRGLGLEVEGLMGVGTAGDDDVTSRGFERLRAAVDRIGLAQCSMGMSGDLERAIAAGSTMVRIGSDLFGPRS